ncbi:MAG: hypothetical protein MUO95_09250 [Methanoregula sp.]|nr:hypothetical protein [Methanoregula sp.]
MKKIVLLVMGLLFLSGFTSAYLVNIDAPDSLPVGKPLIVNGTTTFGIGTPIDVVLYYQLTTTTEIKRKIVYVQSDHTFRAVFDTTGLKTGMYKVEVPTNGAGNSVNMRVVYLFDRSDYIQLSSSTTQNFNGKIIIAGTIKGDENSGVQIEVIGPDDDVVFGPRYINTDYQGNFAIDATTTEPGDYEVSFTDARGYVGKRIITVTSQQNQTLGASPTSTTLSIVSAHAKSSRDNPVYFAIKTGNGKVNIHTSSSIDWVIEYVDDKGTIKIVNEEGEQYPETAQVLGKGKTMYIKVYPLKNSVNSEVFIYAENAVSVVVSPTIPAPFAVSVPQTPTDTPKSPLLPLLGVVALGIVFIIVRRNQ